MLRDDGTGRYRCAPSLMAAIASQPSLREAVVRKLEELAAKDGGGNEYDRCVVRAVVAAFARGSWPLPPAHARFFAQLLRHDDPGVRTAAAKWIRNQPTLAGEILEELLNTSTVYMYPAEVTATFQGRLNLLFDDPVDWLVHLADSHPGDPKVCSAVASSLLLLPWFEMSEDGQSPDAGAPSRRSERIVAYLVEALDHHDLGRATPRAATRKRMVPGYVLKQAPDLGNRAIDKLVVLALKGSDGAAVALQGRPGVYERLVGCLSDQNLPVAGPRILAAVRGDGPSSPICLPHRLIGQLGGLLTCLAASEWATRLLQWGDKSLAQTLQCRRVLFVSRVFHPHHPNFNYAGRHEYNDAYSQYQVFASFEGQNYNGLRIGPLTACVKA